MGTWLNSAGGTGWHKLSVDFLLVICYIVRKGGNMTVAKFMKKVKRSKARIYFWLKSGRILGAGIDGSGNWIIPDDAVAPVAMRPGRKARGFRR